MSDTRKIGVTLPRSEAEELLMRALLLIEKENRQKGELRFVRCPKTNLLLCKTNGSVEVWCRKCKCEHKFDGFGRLVI